MHEKRPRTVAEVGEFGLIALLADALPAAVRADRVMIGIGDDAAVWPPPADADLVITTDSLIEGIHFRLDWTDWESLGYKALAVNLSDIAAMGARPRLAVVTLGLRGGESVADLTALYQGLGRLAAREQTAIAGGDVVRSPHAVMLSITAIGEVPTGRALTRAGARAGDVIAVSGTLGAAAAGLALLAEGERETTAARATGGLLIAAHLRPEPRLSLGVLLRDLGATAAMDLSDGLLGDLPKMLVASRVRAEIAIERIPVAAAVHALGATEWERFALRGGEDYELLFTAPPAAFNEIRAAGREAGTTVTAIGEIHAAVDRNMGTILLTRDGRAIPIAAGAFDHFASVAG